MKRIPLCVYQLGYGVRKPTKRVGLSLPRLDVSSSRGLLFKPTSDLPILTNAALEKIGSYPMHPSIRPSRRRRFHPAAGVVCSVNASAERSRFTARCSLRISFAYRLRTLQNFIKKNFSKCTHTFRNLFSVHLSHQCSALLKNK